MSELTWFAQPATNQFVSSAFSSFNYYDKRTLIQINFIIRAGNQAFANVACRPGIFIGFASISSIIQDEFTLGYYNDFIHYDNVPLSLVPNAGYRCIHTADGRNFYYDDIVLAQANLPFDITKEELTVVAKKCIELGNTAYQLSWNDILQILGKAPDDGGDDDDDPDCDCPDDEPDKEPDDCPPKWPPHCDWPYPDDPNKCPPQDHYYPPYYHYPPNYCPPKHNQDDPTSCPPKYYPPPYYWHYHPDYCPPKPDDDCSNDDDPDKCPDKPKCPPQDDCSCCDGKCKGDCDCPDDEPDDCPSEPVCQPIVPCLGDKVELFEKLEEAISLIQKDLYCKSVQVASSIESLVQLIGLNEQIGILTQDQTCELLNNEVKEMQEATEKVLDQTDNWQDGIDSDCGCDDQDD